MTTLKLTTAAGSNASLVGERYSAFDGVSWRNSVDACDSDGCGRVFLDCTDDEVAAQVCDELETDDEVTQFAYPA